MPWLGLRRELSWQASDKPRGRKPRAALGSVARRSMGIVALALAVAVWFGRLAEVRWLEPLALPLWTR